MTTDITQISDYKEIKVIIKAELESLASGFVSLGFFLKKVRDEELYIQGNYKDVFDFAQNEYNLSRSVTSRWMAINDKFSIDGNSPEINTNYKGYGSSLLSEMLTLPEENYVLVAENTTVAQIRDMKKEFTEDDRIPGQLEISNYPQYSPESARCDVAHAENVDSALNDTLSTFIKWYYANEGKQKFEETLKILRRTTTIEPKSEQIMYCIAPSKFKVFKISSDGVMFNVVCNDSGISILKLGEGKEDFPYLIFIYRFEDLFGLDGTPEEIYKKYYNIDLKESENVEITQTESESESAKKEDKEAEHKKEEWFMNEPEEDPEELDQIAAPEEKPEILEEVTEAIEESEEELEEIFDKEEIKCRVCGCTWDNPCEGGCHWVEEDLCSKCAAEEIEDVEVVEADIVEPIIKDKPAGYYETFTETITWHVIEDAPVDHYKDILLAIENEKKAYITTGSYQAGSYTSYEDLDGEYRYWADMPQTPLGTNFK